MLISEAYAQAAVGKLAGIGEQGIGLGFDALKKANSDAIDLIHWVQA